MTDVRRMWYCGNCKRSFWVELPAGASAPIMRLLILEAHAICWPPPDPACYPIDGWLALCSSSDAPLRVDLHEVLR